MSAAFYLQDVTLRDGMHAVGHDFSTAQVQKIAAALDAAGVDAIEVAHGDGLGGSSLTYGPGAESTLDLISAAREVISSATLTTLLLPGIGTVRDLEEAYERGARSVRVATHCTEADVSREHVARGRELGMDVSGFLMMAHLTSPQTLADQAALMESYGAHCVYVTDSAGHLTPRGVRERVRALRDRLRADVQVGIHAHQNLSLSVANSLAALDEGAWRVDASLAGLGAGAGNTPIEAFVAAAELDGLEHRSDLFHLIDAADELVRPLVGGGLHLDGTALTIGFAGVYSSFLRHTVVAAERYGVDARSILIESGRRGLIGGQEDMIVDVALELRR